MVEAVDLIKAIDLVETVNLVESRQELTKRHDENLKNYFVYFTIERIIFTASINLAD